MSDDITLEEAISRYIKAFKQAEKIKSQIRESSVGDRKNETLYEGLAKAEKELYQMMPYISDAYNRQMEGSENV